MNSFRFFPILASSEGARTDVIYVALVAVSVVISSLVVGALIVFSIRYRRGSGAERGELPEWMRHDFEIGWTVATLFAFLFLGWWASATDLDLLRVPPGAIPIHVVAKQWMWKTQHPDGAREINALHVPIGESVRLEMTSEDVIHSFFVPEFRIKQDVLPNRYTYAWFRADRLGDYHLLCTQLCGTEHSRMVGKVVVMTKADYSAWLVAQPHQDDIAKDGQAEFESLGCSGCHEARANAAAPRLDGLYGKTVALADGGEAVLDDSFIRDIILQPNTHAVKGFAAIMPSYQGLVDDGALVALSAYIRSLAPTRYGAR
jgi:cytochrome c oxidase subunit 2